MQNEYNALVKQEGGWWIGWIEEVPGVLPVRPSDRLAINRSHH